MNRPRRKRCVVMPELLRVLLVEDSIDDALLLIDALRQGGFEPTSRRVDVATDMQQALANDAWDIVLADYRMPHFSGPAALRTLKDSGLDIPFIIVSGTVTNQQAIDMMRDGASDFILKQDLVRLTPAIRRELREAEGRRERRQAELALAREQAFLSSAIELLPFPVIFNTPGGEVIRANKASYQFFVDLGSPTWRQRQLLQPDTGMPLPRDQWPMIRAAHGEVIPPVEHTLIMTDGRTVPVLVGAAPVYVGETLVATVVSFTDISPLKEVDQAKNRFLSLLSHELRTPLTNILGWVQEAKELPEVIPEALHIILRNAEMQRRMLENLLEVSRLLHGKLDLLCQPTDVWHLVLDAVHAMTPQAEERQVSFETLAPATKLPALVDRKRICLVLENILQNALCFSAPDSRVEVRGARDGDMARIAIQDFGHGISPAQLPDVFELFHTSPEIERTGGGLGLGLPLAKAVLEGHGGWITVASAGEGQGTTITIAVPLVDV